MTEVLGSPSKVGITPDGTTRTTWEPNANTRIRHESHPEGLSPGEAGYNPRHHGEHFHVETKPGGVSWNKANKTGSVTKAKPEGYQPGSGTGFLPGEKIPRMGLMNDGVKPNILSDGHIVSIDGHSGNVTVHCRSWRDQTILLSFTGAIGLRAYSPENVDLDGMYSDRNQEAIDEAILFSDDDHSVEFLCFNFVSAWNGKAILTIIASSCRVEVEGEPGRFT